LSKEIGMAADIEHRVRVLRIEQSVNTMALEQYKADGYEDAIRNQAARALAERLIREASVELAVQGPSPDDYSARTVYQFDVAVVMPEDGRSYFADQLAAAEEAGRRRGIQEAVECIKVRAKAMREVNGLIAFNIDAVGTDVANLTRSKAPAA
jgi:hypothetical protein